MATMLFENMLSRYYAAYSAIFQSSQAWETQHIGNTNKFMLSFKYSIVRIFIQRWRQDIESSSKLRTYTLVKKSLCVEPYILNIKGNHLITAMASYRMSSHDLKIERGRFNNPITPINQ